MKGCNIGTHKAKHNLRTLKDVESRLVELQNANATYNKIAPQLVKYQNQGLSAAARIVAQAIKNGYVYRGNKAYPDPLMEYKNNNEESELLQ